MGQAQGEQAGVALAALLEGLGARWLQGEAATRVTGLCIDPAEAAPGVLFVARRGWYHDTHRDLAAVAAAGAAAVVVSDAAALPTGWALPSAAVGAEDPFLGLVSARFHGHPTRRLRVYGVTGTNGKTSTAWLLEHLLRALGERVALMGTLSYRLGGWTQAAPNTTPDGLVIQRFAAAALARGATALVMEVSSHGLAIERVAGVDFDCVGFTNLTPDHLDFHATMGAYRAAKRRLFDDCLRASAAPIAAVACVEPDGEGARMLAAAPPGVARHAVVVGDEAAPEGARAWRARRVGPLAAAGSAWTLEVGGRTLAGRCPLPGDHNLSNLALALAMVGATRPDAREAALGAAASAPPIPGRFELVCAPWPGEPAVFVDYAHTPDALARSLTLARALGRPVSVVFGCGGERDRAKRPLMARVAVDGAERVVLTSDNPRGEAPGAILDAAAAGVPAAAQARVQRIEQRAAAIAAAVMTAGAGVVLLAGKGHEAYQEVAGRRYHLDDREEARRALAARRLGVALDAAPPWSGWSPGRVAAALGGALLREGTARPLLRVREAGDAQAGDLALVEDAGAGLPADLGLIVMTGERAAPAADPRRDETSPTPVVWVSSLEGVAAALARAAADEATRRPPQRVDRGALVDEAAGGVAGAGADGRDAERGDGSR